VEVKDDVYSSGYYITKKTKVEIKIDKDKIIQIRLHDITKTRVRTAIIVLTPIIIFSVVTIIALDDMNITFPLGP